MVIYFIYFKFTCLSIAPINTENNVKKKINHLINFQSLKLLTSTLDGRDSPIRI